MAGTDSKYKSLLAAKEGKEFSSSLMYNIKKLREHSKTAVHVAVINYLKTTKAKTLADEFKEAERKQNDRDLGKYRATANMLRIVYTEVKLNIPLTSHQTLIQLISTTGGEVGIHHYERTSATRMAKFISDIFHQNLVNYILKSDGPWSIICDGSTDAWQNHYLVVLLQGIEENLPKVYLYRLILIGSDETAQGLLDLIVDAFGSDGILDKMENNLIGFAADGASVNLGKKAGLGVKLQEVVGRPLVIQHCLAHRLHLAIRNVFQSKKEFKYMFHFESLLKKLYQFYYNKGHKRKAHLREMMEDVDEEIFTLNNILEVRWIASEKSAVDRVIRHYPVIIKHLMEVSESGGFDKKTKQSAKNIKNKLIEKNFVVLLHFLADLLGILSQSSLQFQMRYGTLIDQVDNYKKLSDAIERAGSRNGEFLTKLWKESNCGQTDDPTSIEDKCQSLQSLEDNPHVTYRGIDLTPWSRRVQSPYKDLSQVRGKMTTALLNEVNSSKTS